MQNIDSQISFMYSNCFIRCHETVHVSLSHNFSSYEI